MTDRARYANVGEPDADRTLVWAGTRLRTPDPSFTPYDLVDAGIANNGRHAREIVALLVTKDHLKTVWDETEDRYAAMVEYQPEPPPPPAPNKRRPAMPNPKTCGCSCGGTTKGGAYLPGHDAKHVSAVVKQINDPDAGSNTNELLAELATDKLRNKARAQLAS